MPPPGSPPRARRRLSDRWLDQRRQRDPWVGLLNEYNPGTENGSFDQGLEATG
jgi:hypothetical protein